MKTIFDNQKRIELIERINKLTPSSKRLWGTMAVNEMLCHLIDNLLCALGEKEFKETGNIFHHTILKWLALYVITNWPKGLKTAPELDSHQIGSKPTDFKKDLQNLLNLIQRVNQLPEDFKLGKHPIFGKMSTMDWQRDLYINFNHHLKQFGV